MAQSKTTEMGKFERFDKWAAIIIVTFMITGALTLAIVLTAQTINTNKHQEHHQELALEWARENREAAVTGLLQVIADNDPETIRREDPDRLRTWIEGSITWEPRDGTRNIIGGETWIPVTARAEISQDPGRISVSLPFRVTIPTEIFNGQARGPARGEPQPTAAEFRYWWK